MTYTENGKISLKNFYFLLFKEGQGQKVKIVGFWFVNQLAL
jgi:hypothetical protein